MKDICQQSQTFETYDVQNTLLSTEETINPPSG